MITLAFFILIVAFFIALFEPQTKEQYGFVILCSTLATFILHCFNLLLL